MPNILSQLLKFVRDEPALTLQLAGLGLSAIVTLGLPIGPEKQLAITTLIGIVVSVVIRQNVTPTKGWKDMGK